jgi:DNA invertase Pin-like site-specific DNA recombinase
MPNIIGYARVSSQGQELQLQLDALLQAGCTKNKIFLDQISGTKIERTGLSKCLAELKSGDTLLVWRLDRLGRSIPHLVSLIEDLRVRGVGFRSICDGVIDTTTASGELIFNVFASLAQFELRLIQERTRAGLIAARSRGQQGGRKKVEDTATKVIMAKNMYKSRNVSINDICETLQISRARFYRYVAL